MMVFENGVDSGRSRTGSTQAVREQGEPILFDNGVDLLSAPHLQHHSCLLLISEPPAEAATLHNETDPFDQFWQWSPH